METFYSTHAIEQLRSAFVPLLQRIAPADAAYTLALTNYLERSIKFRLPDAGDLLGIDRRARTFNKDEFDILHMPYPVTALEYTFAPEKHSLTREHSFLSSRRITLVFDIPAGKDKAPLFQSMADSVPGFSDQGGIVIMGYWSNTEDGQPAAPDESRVDWEVSTCSLFIPRNQEPENLGLAPNGVFPARFGDLCVYYCVTMPILYKANAARIGKQQMIRTMTADLGDDLHVAFDFMLALSCNNVSVAPADGESRAKLNKKRIANKKIPFFEYRQLMISGVKLDANASIEGTPASRNDGGGRASPRLHLRRGHIRRLATGTRKWVNFAVVGAATQGQIAKDYVLRATERTPAPKPR